MTNYPSRSGCRARRAPGQPVRALAAALVLAIACGGGLAAPAGASDEATPATSEDRVLGREAIIGKLIPITGDPLETRSLDLRVEFRINSADLTEAAAAQLRELGAAPDLRGASGRGGRGVRTHRHERAGAVQPGALRTACAGGRRVSACALRHRRCAIPGGPGIRGGAVAGRSSSRCAGAAAGGDRQLSSGREQGGGRPGGGCARVRGVRQPARIDAAASK